MASSVGLLAKGADSDLRRGGGGVAGPPDLPLAGTGAGTSDRQLVEQAAAALPFARELAIQRVASALPSAVDFAICVPAQNEQRFLSATLAALLAAQSGSGARGVIVLLINNSSDKSWDVACDLLGAAGSGYLVADIALNPCVADAPHARRIALDIGALLAADGVLMTTDADTIVAPDWACANLRHIRSGSALVCGSVSIDPQEYDALPAPVRHWGAVEAEYFDRLESLWRSWTGGTAPRFAISAMGASLALPTARYRAIGGMPTPPVAEDKALAALARRCDWPIALAGDVRVETSCRLFARAAGGMGDALRARATDDDPFCDEQLVPVALLRRLADIWNDLPPGAGRFARLQDRMERDPGLRHRRMRMSQIIAELANSSEAAPLSGARM